MENAQPNARRTEMIIAAFLLAAMMAGQILICHQRALYHQGYWVDEYFTYLIASDPSPTHALAALRSGLDGTPPTYHFIVRVAHYFLRGEPLADYRVCSTIAIWIALLALYGTLRHAVNRTVAAVAVLAVWSHPMTIYYAFEARPYAMWFAGTACVAWTLRMNSPRRNLLLFLAAVFTCTIHYFGIVSLAFLLGAELIFGPGLLAERARRILPGVLGSLALLPLLPLAIAQHRGISPGWTEPFGPHAAGHMIEEIFYSPALIAIVIAWWISQYFQDHQPQRARFSTLAALFALCFLPIFFFIFSAIGDSVMVDRYFFVTLLGTAAIFAMLLAQSARVIVVVLGILLFIMALLVMHVEAGTKHAIAEYHQQLAENAEKPGNSYALLFPTRHDAFELWFEHPELRRRIALMDLTGVAMPRDVAFEQRLHRRTEHDYDLPPMRDVRYMPGMPFQFIGDPALLEVIRQTIPLTEINARQQIYELKQ